MTTVRLVRTVPLLLATSAALAACANGHPVHAHPLPAAKLDPVQPDASDRVAVLAGGCFWGMEAVFAHVRGVHRVESGYAGGHADTAHYGRVERGDTGHAESVRIVYDPKQVSYGTLLRVFFAVAHDPTQRDRQGPDVGRQYRSAVFYTAPSQRRVAAAYIAQLRAAHAFAEPIVTELAPLHGFYPAEAYHQDYAERHPHDLYIVLNDAPRVAALQREFADLYRAGPAP